VRVLLAHSSAPVHEEVSELFERLGWELLHARDGLEAERLCRTGHPDVAVIDAELEWPGEESRGGHIRADSELRRVRVLVLCRDLELEEALAGLDEGLEYIVAPIAPDELAVRVKNLERMRALEARLDDQRAELRQLLHADSLTGLYDRRFVNRQLGAQVNGALRHGQPLSILMLDLDNLKTLNDTHGHACGDDALKAVARVLEARLRDTDIAGRWGGDEFLVILPATGQAAALRVAEDLVAAAAAVEGFSLPLTLSVGCAEWQQDDPSELLERADQALYEAKRAGRNRVVVADPRAIEISVARAPALAEDRALRVLLVDDVDTVRKLLRLSLEGSGVEIVGEAENGAEAVEVALATRPDLVIMDWNMPIVDGIQGTRAVLEALPETTVVAFSSTDDPRIHRALIDAGAVGNFDKGDLGPLLEFVVGRAVPRRGQPGDAAPSSASSRR
jgi:two-component system cell cycle response regulator